MRYLDLPNINIEDHPPSFPPSESAILEFSRINSSSVTVTWREWNENTDLGYGPVAAYKLEYRQAGGRFHEIRLDKEITTRQVNELAHDTLYEFRLVVGGDGIFSGYGPPTGIYPIRIPCGVPSNPVLTVNSTTVRSAIFHVQIPRRDEWKCSNLIAKLERKDGNIWKFVELISTEQTTAQVNVEGLNPCTISYYRIQISNNNETATSEEVELQTDPSVDPPPSLKFVSSTTNSARLNVTIYNYDDWSCDISAKVKLGPQTQDGVWSFRKLALDLGLPESSHDVNDLSPCTNYKYKLKISYSGGTLFSDEAEFMTKPTNPGKPSFEIKSYTSNSATFSVEVSSASDWSCGGAIMYIEKLDNEGRWAIQQNLSISDTEIVQNELKSCTSYTYRISILADGDPVVSNNVTFTSRASGPTAPSLGITSQHDSSAILNVAVPRQEDWSCANWTIRLHRKELNSATWELRKTFHTIPTSISETGLQVCTTYQYQVNITASIGENSMHSEGSDVQSGLTEIGSGVLQVVTTITAPSSLLDVSLVSIGKSSLEVGWTTPNCICCNDFINSYSYILKQNGDVYLQSESTLNRTAKFDDLIPYTNYTFQVRASNAGGHGDYCEPVRFLTLEDIPPKMNPPNRDWNATAIRVSWEPPIPPHGLITLYQIKFGLIGETATQEDIIPPARDWTATNLQADSSYALMVRAQTIIGFGNWSESVHITTDEAAPLPPRNVTIQGRSKTWFQVEWNPSSNNNGNITKYRVTCTEQESPTSKPLYEAFIMHNPSKVIYRANITSLEPSTTYEIMIFAYTSAGMGQPRVVTVSTKVTSDLTRLDATGVKVSPSKSTSGGKGFKITLPPLTQKYATNYVIATIITGEKSSYYRILRVFNRSDDEITFYLTAQDLKDINGNNTQYSGNLIIYVGVESKCGGESTIVWSDAIEIPVTIIRLSSNDLFVIIIVSSLALAMTIFLIAFTSIMVCRHFQDDWSYKRAEFDRDGSNYLALEKRATSTLDRYMPLKIKVPPEKKITSVTSLSKLTGNSPAEDGEGEPLSKTLDLIVFGPSLVDKASRTKSTDTSASNGDVDKGIDVVSTQTDVNGLMPEPADNMQHSKMVTRSNDVTARKGSLAALRPLTEENKAVVQKAVAKFKSARPQIYNSEIYDQSNTARIMNSESVKNRGQSEEVNGLNSSFSGGNMTRQSYDKVIVTNESQIIPRRNMVTFGKGDLRNHRLSGSYFEPDEETMGKSGRKQTGSYIDVNEIGTPQYISPGLLGTPSRDKENDVRAGSAYMKVFEPLLNKDRDLPLPPINPTQTTTTSYMEIEGHGKAGDNSLQTPKLRPTYLNPDVERIKMKRNGTICSSKASYIELDEEGMTRTGWTR
ncbi:hypothetical protein BSL78_01432 [Apostichopus japonicus]|uniref:Fibronectin type-III domain-containing protein n=1 Tax=Stichopus japonicus TaxID=307972 RepID=A0A2G8LN08_STIJA|nr:hypothetical protein BSL78_01432 [Apostichopus japonicus]